MDEDRRSPVTNGAFSEFTVTRRGLRKPSGRPDLDAMLWHLMERAIEGQWLSRTAMEEVLLRQAVVGASVKPRPRVSGRTASRTA